MTLDADEFMAPESIALLRGKGSGHLTIGVRASAYTGRPSPRCSPDCTMPAMSSSMPRSKVASQWCCWKYGAASMRHGHSRATNSSLTGSAADGPRA